MLKKIGLILSAFILVFMGAADGKIAVAIGGLLLLFFVGIIVTSKNTESIFKLLRNPSTFMCTACMSLINGVIFYIRWHDSELCHQIFASIGFHAKIGMMLLTVLGMACVLPFLAWFCQWMKQTGDRWLISKVWCERICYICTAIGIILQLIFCFGKGIWVDESFTLAMLRHNYTEMIHLTAIDVHPPLYYILLKIWIDFWKIFFSGSVITVLSKLFSVIPCIILVVVALTKLRKQWGTFVSAVWVLSTVSVSYLISNGVEIRMYSWALLFVTLSLVFMSDIIVQNKIVNWCLFVIVSLAAAYTHYYACLGVAVVYGMLFLWLLWKRRELLLRWFIAAITTIVGYLPWLFVFFKQAQTVSDNYWINKIGTRTIISYFSYLFDHNVLLLVILILVWSMFAEKKINKFSVYYALTGICVPVGVIGAGVLASILIRPVFVIRYVIPSIGCLWFGVMIATKELKRENAKKLLIFVLVTMFVLNSGLFIKEEVYEYTETEKIYKLLEESKEVVFVSDNYHVQDNIQVLSGAKSLLWNRQKEELDDRNDNLLKKVYGELDNIASVEEVHALLNEYGDVYFVAKEDGTDIEAFADANGVTYTDMGEFYMEYKVRIYKLQAE